MHQLCRFRGGIWSYVNWRALFFAGVGFLLIVSLSTAEAESNRSSEYQVKAAFLYNFAKFIEWPAETMGSATQPFNICLLGDDSVRQELERVMNGKSIDNHVVRIIQVHTPVDSHLCHILFITTAAAAKEAHYLALLRDSSVLTVGETRGFCSRGGIINFWLDSEHVRFEINPRAAQRARLLPSSKLLRLATVVAESTEAEGSQ